MSARMKSNSAGPDCARMSRFKLATDASLRSISPVTMAGSVSIGSGGAGGGGPAGPSSGRDRMKPRSRTVCSAPPISGSDFPRTATVASRVAGDARRLAMSTNSRPPASCITGKATSWCTERPSGFMGSVIICWWPTER